MSKSFKCYSNDTHSYRSMALGGDLCMLKIAQALTKAGERKCRSITVNDTNGEYLNNTSIMFDSVVLAYYLTVCGLSLFVVEHYLNLV